MAGQDFLAIRHASLAAAGLGQKGVMVGFGAGGLALRGNDGGTLAVPWSSITRVRVGAYSPKYGDPLYRMIVWTSAAPGPLRLATIHRDEAAFAAIARTAGLRVLSARGPGALEGGLGWWDALNYPLFMAVGMVLAFLAATHDPAVTHADGDALYTALFMLGFTVLVEAVLYIFFVRPYRPRPLATMAELEALLPAGK